MHSSASKKQAYNNVISLFDLILLLGCKKFSQIEVQTHAAEEHSCTGCLIKFISKEISGPEHKYMNTRSSYATAFMFPIRTFFACA